MNFNEVFKVRAIKKGEEDIYVITIGDKLASTEEFQTARQAQMKSTKQIGILPQVCLQQCSKVKKNNKNKKKQLNKRRNKLWLI